MAKVFYITNRESGVSYPIILREHNITTEMSFGDSNSVGIKEYFTERGVYFTDSIDLISTFCDALNYRQPSTTLNDFNSLPNVNAALAVFNEKSFFNYQTASGIQYGIDSEIVPVNFMSSTSTTQEIWDVSNGNYFICLNNGNIQYYTSDDVLIDTLNASNFWGGVSAPVQGFLTFAINPETFDATTFNGIATYQWAAFNQISNRVWLKYFTYTPNFKHHLYMILNGTRFEDLDDLDLDPYARGGNSTPAGGGGNFDNSSDNIDIPSPPLIDVTDSNMVSLYHPSLSQIQSFANWLWEDKSEGFWDSFKQIEQNPIEAVISLTMIPFDAGTGATRNMTIGNLDSGIECSTYPSQYAQFNCGSIEVSEYYGSYLDYAPYTSIQLYLPFIGNVALDANEVMNTTLHVVYNVDIVTGSCVANVSANNRVLYSFNGNVAQTIPITSRDYSNVVNGLLTGVMGFVGSVARGNVMGGVGSAMSAIQTTAQGPAVQHSGSVGGSNGFLGVQVPYLTITRPRMSLAKNQVKYSGYPSNIGYKLSDLTGYTVVESINLKCQSASEEEKNDIINILTGGVIL